MIKKQSLILWICAILIAFGVSYLKTITSNNYPVTGTIGIDGKKVSYRFEKTHHINHDLNIIIRSDLDSLAGKVFWKDKSSKDNWNSIELKNSASAVIAKIPKQKPMDIIDYYVEINHKNKKYLLPDNQKITLTFYGKISPALKILQFILLYLGLLLSIRIGFEYVNNSENSKKLSVINVIVYLTLTLLLNPLYISYKNGYINNSIPGLSKLFPVEFLSLLFLWIITTLILFIKPDWKFTSILSGALTVLIFIFLF